MSGLICFRQGDDMIYDDPDSTTIAAISTPPGAGGIGIIRMSGPAALFVLKAVFQPLSSSCRFASHRFYYGTIRNPENGRLLDEVLAVYMKAPKTYTREHVVEIHCHGSYFVLQSILDLILTFDIDLATPGEFTKRAFLNGRIDLTRAEAVIDILSARTKKGVDLALEQMSGRLYRSVDRIRTSLVHIRALFEVAIDFPDEDIEIVDRGAVLKQLRTDVVAPLEQLIKSADSGRMIRDGVSVVIVGLPNVGKSSLLNTLLQEERALVTAIPGTTRDTIEEYVDINGIPVRIIDTAGIRDSTEEVEQLGINRAREQINRADLVLFLVDGARRLLDDDRLLFASVSHKPSLTLVNKCDLEETLDRETDIHMFAEALSISALTQDGIASLKDAIFKRITGGREQWQEEGCAPNLRHKAAMERALGASLSICSGIEAGLTSDLLTIDILDCLDHLAEVVGETTTEDVLDVVFEQFCLGK
jgi:tRNA modification GTPase